MPGKISTAGFSVSTSKKQIQDQYTIPEVAELLGTGDQTVRRWIARGELRAYRYGPRLIRIDATDLLAFRKEVNPATFEHVSGGGAK